MKRMLELRVVIAAFLILLIYTFSIPAAAAGVNYSVSSSSGYQGDTVTVSVNASASNVWGCSISLGFNPSELEYVSSSKGGIVTSGSLNPKGASVNFSGMISGANGGTIFTVTFKILKASGSCVLSLSASGGGDNVDSDLNPVSFTTSGGTIKVKEKETTTTQKATETTTKAETTTQSIAVASISLNKNSITLDKGETASLSATVTPSNATNKSVTYRSSNIYVARVSDTGKVTAVGGGTATITASAGGKSTTCKVSVISKQTGITYSGKAEKSIEVGQTMNLTVEKVPSDATDTYITSWSSSDRSVVSVTEGGVITGVKEGSAKITAVSNGWELEYRIEVLPKEEESSTETETETETEISTAVETTKVEIETTTEDTEEGNIVSKLLSLIPEDGNREQKQYYIFAGIISLIIIVAVTVAVALLVTKNIRKNKDKSKDPMGPEDK